MIYTQRRCFYFYGVFNVLLTVVLQFCVTYESLNEETPSQSPVKQ